MARKRTGTLILKASGYFAKVWAKLPSGEEERRTINLETTDRATAKRRLAKLVRELEAGRLEVDATKGELSKPDVVTDIAWPWNERRRVDGVVMWSDEKLHLRDYILPVLGRLPVQDVRTLDCQDVIDTAFKKKALAQEYLKKIRGTMGRLFKEARRLEIMTHNPVELVTLPRAARARRSPEQLTDDQVAEFFACREVDVELKILSIVARCEAGMRTGDLNRWDWQNIDTDGFLTCDIYRGKTKQWQEGIEVPPVLRPWLRAWWEAFGSPKSGPVFPVRHGKNRGGFKAKRGTSYAKRLQKAIGKAGIAYDAFTDEAGVHHPAKCPELLHGSPKRAPCNFHSFRHAFNSALAASGVNAQHAMSLASHSDMKTHMGYVDAGRAEMKLIPAAALPQLSQPGTFQRRPGRSSITEGPVFQYARSDSNGRHSASKADALSS